MSDNLFKNISILIFNSWLILFILLPLSIILFITFLEPSNDTFLSYNFTFDNYRHLFSLENCKVFLRSLKLAIIVTLICLIIGFPFAYLISKIDSKFKLLLILLTIIPFWMSSLIKIYSIITILSANGLLNNLLLFLGLIDEPLSILYRETAVIIGMIYDLLPFMILPLYLNFEKIDCKLIDAALDLGSSKFRILTNIIIPLLFPGIIVGSLLVFLPAMTLFYIPDILGGAKTMLLGNLISDKFLLAFNWPEGATLTLLLIIIIILFLPLYLFHRYRKENFS